MRHDTPPSGENELGENAAIVVIAMYAQIVGGNLSQGLMR